MGAFGGLDAPDAGEEDGGELTEEQKAIVALSARVDALSEEEQAIKAMSDRLDGLSEDELRAEAARRGIATEEYDGEPRPIEEVKSELEGFLAKDGNAVAAFLADAAPAAQGGAEAPAAAEGAETGAEVETPATGGPGPEAGAESAPILSGGGSEGAQGEAVGERLAEGLWTREELEALDHDAVRAIARSMGFPTLGGLSKAPIINIILSHQQEVAQLAEEGRKPAAEQSADDLSGKTMQELRRAARELGISPAGDKAHLAARIREAREKAGAYRVERRGGKLARVPTGEGGYGEWSEGLVRAEAEMRGLKGVNRKTPIDIVRRKLEENDRRSEQGRKNLAKVKNRTFEDPFLNAVFPDGKSVIRVPSQRARELARKDAGAPQIGGEWDGFDPARFPGLGDKFRFVDSDWTDIDARMQEAFEAYFGLGMEEGAEGGRDRTPDAFWDMLEQAAKTERKAKAYYAEQAEEGRQAERFAQDALTERGGKETVQVQELAVGDKVVVRGQQLTVTEVDPDSGEATLSDGSRYGEQSVDDGKTLHVEMVSTRAENAAAAAAGVPDKVTLHAMKREDLIAQMRAEGVALPEAAQLARMAKPLLVAKILKHREARGIAQAKEVDGGFGFGAEGGEAEERGEAAPALVLEGASPAETAAEEKRRLEREEMQRRIDAPLDGGKPLEVGQSLMDLGGAEGGGDLFNRVARREEPGEGPRTAPPRQDADAEEKTPQSVKERPETPEELTENAGTVQKTDKHGNPINDDGTLKLDKVESVADLTDEDFTAPTRNVQLPQIPANVDAAIGANGKPVVIKRNIFDKNRKGHSDITGEKSRNILARALYNPDLAGKTQPVTRPNYTVVIQTGDGNAVTVLEVSQTKDNVEIVGWRTINARSLEQMKRQAAREGGQLLVLRPSEDGQSVGFSERPRGLPAEGVDTSSPDSTIAAGDGEVKGQAAAPAVRVVRRGGKADRVPTGEGGYGAWSDDLVRAEAEMRGLKGVDGNTPIDEVRRKLEAQDKRAEQGRKNLAKVKNRTFEDPFLNAVFPDGKSVIRVPSRRARELARKDANAPQVGGEWDGFDPARFPGLGDKFKFVHSGWTDIDARMQEVFEAYFGLGMEEGAEGGRDRTPDAFWDMLEQAAKTERQVKAHYAEQAAEGRQSERFAQDALTSRGGGKTIQARELGVGDKVMVRGQELTVTEVDPDNDSVLLSDGARYGEQSVDDGKTLHVEAVSTRAENAAASAAGVPDKVALAGMKRAELLEQMKAEGLELPPPGRLERMAKHDLLREMLKQREARRIAQPQEEKGGNLSAMRQRVDDSTDERTRGEGAEELKQVFSRFLPGVKFVDTKEGWTSRGLAMKDKDGRTVIGAFNPRTGEVYLNPNGIGRAAIPHEVGWHAVVAWARKNDTRFYNGLMDAVRRMPPAILRDVETVLAERYPGLKRGTADWLDEAGAFLYERVNREGIDKAFAAPGQRFQWRQVAKVLLDAWRAMLRALGFREVDRAKYEKMAPEQVMQSLFEDAMAGRRLGRYEGAESGRTMRREGENAFDPSNGRNDLSKPDNAKAFKTWIRSLPAEESPAPLKDPTPKNVFAWFEQNMVGKTYSFDLPGYGHHEFKVAPGHIGKLVCEGPTKGAIKKTYEGHWTEAVRRGDIKGSDVSGWHYARARELPRIPRLLTAFDAVLHEVDKGTDVFIFIKKFNTKNGRPNTIVMKLVDDGKSIGPITTHIKDLTLEWLKNKDLVLTNEGEVYNRSANNSASRTPPAGDNAERNSPEGKTTVPPADGKATENNIQQRITSAGTSLPKNDPTLYKSRWLHASLRSGAENLDIGAGRTERPTQRLAEMGVRNVPFDPFNREQTANASVIRDLQGGKRYPTVTVANVLNVIAEPESRSNVILQAAKALADGGKAFFDVYTAPKEGETRSGTYQTAMHPEEYIPELERWFGKVERHGSILVASEPKAEVAKTKASWWDANPAEGGSTTMFRLGGKQDAPAPFGVDEARQRPRARGTTLAEWREAVVVEEPATLKGSGKNAGKEVPNKDAGKFRIVLPAAEGRRGAVLAGGYESAAAAASELLMYQAGFAETEKALARLPKAKLQEVLRARERAARMLSDLSATKGQHFAAALRAMKALGIPEKFQAKAARRLQAMVEADGAKRTERSALRVMKYIDGTLSREAAKAEYRELLKTLNERLPPGRKGETGEIYRARNVAMPELQKIPGMLAMDAGEVARRLARMEAELGAYENFKSGLSENESGLDEDAFRNLQWEQYLLRSFGGLAHDPNLLRVIAAREALQAVVEQGRNQFLSEEEERQHAADMAAGRAVEQLQAGERVPANDAEMKGRSGFGKSIRRVLNSLVLSIEAGRTLVERMDRRRGVDPESGEAVGLVDALSRCGDEEARLNDEDQTAIIGGGIYDAVTDDYQPPAARILRGIGVSRKTAGWDE